MEELWGEVLGISVDYLLFVDWVFIDMVVVLFN